MTALVFVLRAVINLYYVEQDVALCSFDSYLVSVVKGHTGWYKSDPSGLDNKIAKWKSDTTFRFDLALDSKAHFLLIMEHRGRLPRSQRMYKRTHTILPVYPEGCFATTIPAKSL